jgi:hypothetical protein
MITFLFLWHLPHIHAVSLASISRVHFHLSKEFNLSAYSEQTISYRLSHTHCCLYIILFILPLCRSDALKRPHAPNGAKRLKAVVYLVSIFLPSTTALVLNLPHYNGKVD